ncbi:MAG: T9SS type A sorting domain-containing protein [Flavobacteriales bacterium]|nr:T9SS type A sorting domain-containing protein [Flavobacteriales bacterium]
MKNTNELLKKIATYSSVIGAVVGVNQYANAELVGYNLDPDSTRFNPADTAGYFVININNRGGYCDEGGDFEFSITQTLSATTSSENGRNLAIYAYTYNGVLASSKAYVNSSVTTTTSLGAINTQGSSTYKLWKAKVMSTGSYVGPDAATDDAMFASDTATLAWGYDTNPSNSWGNWGEKTDKYLGLTFVTWDVDASKSFIGDTVWDTTRFYGWIYMSVGVDAVSYTVQAWAYNDTPGEPALANMDSVDFTDECNLTPMPVLDTNFIGIATRNLESKVSIYSYDRTVNVNLKGTRSTKGSISIYDISGKLVQSEPIKGRNNSLRINGRNDGLYFVKVDVDGGTRTQKVYIQ